MDKKNDPEILPADLDNGCCVFAFYLILGAIIAISVYFEFI